MEGHVGNNVTRSDNAKSATSISENLSKVSKKSSTQGCARTYALVAKTLKYPEMPTREFMEKYSPPILTKLSNLNYNKKHLEIGKEARTYHCIFVPN